MISRLHPKRIALTDRTASSLHAMRVCFERGIELLDDDVREYRGSGVELDWGDEDERNVAEPAGG